MMSLKEIHDEYERIMTSEELSYGKDMRLSGLMDIMKRTFGIPLLVNEEWEKNNRKVIALYRKISMSRTTV